MNELLHYVQIRHEDNKEQLDAANELLEYLYFVHIKPIFKRLRWSDEYRIAQDLLQLKKAVNTGKLETARLRTDFVKKLLSDYGIVAPLTQEDKQIIENNILREHRYYITAAFIADVVNRQARQEQLKWLVTAIIALMAALASLDWLFN
jgi:hypothetical protein